jgi:hypothetical protein
MSIQMIELEEVQTQHSTDEALELSMHGAAAWAATAPIYPSCQ